MSKVTYVYVQRIELMHRGCKGRWGVWRYMYMASYTHGVSGLADRYLILMGTKCYRDI